MCNFWTGLRWQKLGRLQSVRLLSAHRDVPRQPHPLPGIDFAILHFSWKKILTNFYLKLKNKPQTNVNLTILDKIIRFYGTKRS
jgi:hypothetical protein